MTTTARTPDDLRAISDPTERIAAADGYIAAGEAKLRQARDLRNHAIRELVEQVGPSEAARRSGKSLSYVTSLRR